MAPKKARKFVFKITDVPFLETPDGTMRDSFMITEETCAAQEMTAGLVFVKPHTMNHEDIHDVEELFYIVKGKGKITYDGKPMDVEAGDMVFMPAHVAHRVINDTDKPYVAVWAILTKTSDLGEKLLGEMKTWKEIEPNKGWSKWPFMPKKE
jgi:quercetin dioxygenase-like cupin family protein